MKLHFLPLFIVQVWIFKCKPHNLQAALKLSTVLVNECFCRLLSTNFQHTLVGIKKVIILQNAEQENIIMKANVSEERKENNKSIFESSVCFGDYEDSWEI